MGYCKPPPSGVIAGGGLNLFGMDIPKMVLDNALLETLAPRATPYKATDSKGLYLLIRRYELQAQPHALFLRRRPLVVIP